MSQLYVWCPFLFLCGFFSYVILLICGAISQLSPRKKKRRLDILPFEDSGTNLLPGDVRAHVPGA